MAYAAEGEEPARLGNHDPAWAPHNCYPAAGRGPLGDDRLRLRGPVAGPVRGGRPGRWPTTASSTPPPARPTRPTSTPLLAAWTAGRDRWETTRLLQARGVAAFPSQPPLGLWRADPQLGAIGMLERPDHPGHRHLHGAGHPAGAPAPGPTGCAARRRCSASTPRRCSPSCSTWPRPRSPSCEGPASSAEPPAERALPGPTCQESRARECRPGSSGIGTETLDGNVDG